MNINLHINTYTMFILRKINGQGIESNLCIGKDYVLIRQEDGKEFNDTMSQEEYFKSLREDIYAFISCDSGKHILPLYKSQQNYIMLSDGKTFSNLTFK